MRMFNIDCIVGFVLGLSAIPAYIKSKQILQKIKEYRNRKTALDVHLDKLNDFFDLVSKKHDLLDKDINELNNRHFTSRQEITDLINENIVQLVTIYNDGKREIDNRLKALELKSNSDDEKRANELQKVTDVLTSFKDRLYALEQMLKL